MTDASFTVDLGGTGVAAQFSDQREGAEGPGLDPGLIDSLCLAAQRTLEGEGVTAATVDLIAVDSSTIERLNAEHMGHDGPTDVLSFPLDDLSEGESFGFRPHAGDIVFCPQIAADQAPTHAGTLAAELHLLVIHSALHLLGHDHAVDAERIAMQAKEQQYLAAFGLDHPGNQR